MESDNVSALARGVANLQHACTQIPRVLTKYVFKRCFTLLTLSMIFAVCVLIAGVRSTAGSRPAYQLLSFTSCLPKLQLVLFCVVVVVV